MPRPRALEHPHVASETLAHRMTRRVDRLRQFKTRFGIRSERVFLVWTKWSGVERGEGRESILACIELLPTPKVSDLSAVARRPWNAGVMPEGSIRVTEISAGAYTRDNLRGLKIPDDCYMAPHPLPSVPVEVEDGDITTDPTIDFFWEVVEDGRGDDPAFRTRYRVLGGPDRREDMFQWMITLERASQTRDRLGRTQEQDDDVVEILP